MTDLLRVAIVDDERAARERIRRVLQAHARDVDIVALCSTGEEAVLAVREEGPDLVILDVQMPGLDGFGVVHRIRPEHMPLTIFVTAHDKFAVRAFEVSALDYVLKPFSDDRLLEAVQRARTRTREREIMSLQSLSLQTDGGNSAGQAPTDQLLGPLERLLVPQGERTLVVPTGSIDWIRAAGPYAEIHCGDEQYLVRLSMQELEARLDPASFVRIHRSTIVNLDRVTELREHLHGDFLVVLKDGARLRLGRSRRPILEQVLGQRL